jgi:NADH-quinone oxidoreductase subunit N
MPAFDLNQLRLIAPELVLCLGACLLLGLSVLGEEGRRMCQPMAILACVVTLADVVSWPIVHGFDWLRSLDQTTAFGGMFVLDPFAVFFKILFLSSAILTLLISGRFLAEEKSPGGEYYALILFAVVGMMFVASAGDFLTLFIALETMALSFYPLVGYFKKDRRSNEAALKYFLLGSFSTGILLYGISLVYAMTGTTYFELIGMSRSVAALEPDRQPYFLLGVILVTVGLGFKISAVPFHMWAPDAYQGAPTPITGFLSTASSAAGFVALMRIDVLAFARLGGRWALLLAILAVASMTIGNVAAIVQDNIKRMLAYSSVAHAGYALIGLIAVGYGDDLATREWGLQAAILYLLIYTFMNLGAFTLVTILRRQGIVGDQVADFAGLSRRAPWAAFAMLVFMLSLAGIPATAGFVGKWYLFGAAIKANYAWIAVVAVLNSAVSLYYYARVVVMMYMREPADDVVIAPSFGQRFALAACIGFTLAFGIYPQPLVEFARRSIIAFTPWSF